MDGSRLWNFVAICQLYTLGQQCQTAFKKASLVSILGLKRPVDSWLSLLPLTTRKPSYRWQTRATRKHAKNCSNSTCLQRCRCQYWPIFMRLAAVASEICEIQRNSLKIQTYEVQGHPKVIDLGANRKPICDLLLVINSNFSRICYRFRDIHG